MNSSPLPHTRVSFLSWYGGAEADAEAPRRPLWLTDWTDPTFLFGVRVRQRVSPASTHVVVWARHRGRRVGRITTEAAEQDCITTEAAE